MDATGAIISIKDEGRFRLQNTDIQGSYGLCGGKRVSTVDGISLTVIDRTDTTFDVSIVNYTMENTVMCNRKVVIW